MEDLKTRVAVVLTNTDVITSRQTLTNVIIAIARDFGPIL
jgi:hypothetical protein